MSVLLRNLLVAVLLTNAGPAPAESVRELDRAELRKIVTSGGIISLKKAVAAVAASTAAEPIEARAFLADAVVYRMVLKRPDGTLFSVILDAKLKPSPVILKVGLSPDGVSPVTSSAVIVAVS